MLYYIKIMVYFFLTATGPGVPESRVEGPSYLTDADYQKLLFEDKDYCEAVIKHSYPFVKSIEISKHGTEEFKLDMDCAIDEKAA